MITRRGQRRLESGFVGVVLLGVAGGIGWLFHVARGDGGIGKADNWASVIAAVAAMAAMLAGVVVWWWRKRPQGVLAIEQVDAAGRQLAETVLAQWRDEIGVRGLDVPAPVAVHWRTTRLPVMDHARNVRGRSGRVLIGGDTETVAELAQRFRALPSRRLVILGNPELGKTTLAVMLLRELLLTRAEDEPIPVLFTLADWDPEVLSYSDWLARRLGRDYLFLAAAEYGEEAALRLVRNRRILPVLDGFDELPEPVRPKVIKAINAALTADDPLILTSRTKEFQKAVAGGVLSRSAVIEPEAVQGPAAADYLERCLSPDSPGEWPALLSDLRNGPRTALGRALTTPLRLWLLREVYITSHRELVLADLAASPDDVVRALLDQLVPSLLKANRPSRRPDADHPFRPRRSWNASDARRWLAFFAGRLEAESSRDLAWWRLHNAVDRRGRSWNILFLGGMLCGFLAARSASIPGFPGGLLFGLLLTLSTGVLLAFNFLRPAPQQVDLRFRHKGSALKKTVFSPLSLLAVAMGVGVALIVHENATPTGIVLTIVLIWAVTVLFSWATKPASDQQPRTGAKILIHDFWLRTAYALAFGSIAGASGGFGGGLAAGAVVGATASMSAGWVYYLTVIMLRAESKAPLRTLSFLEDFHRLGLLRQVGPIYQFRHAMFQEYFAAVRPPAGDR